MLIDKSHLCSCPLSLKLSRPMKGLQESSFNSSHLLSLTCKGKIILT